MTASHQVETRCVVIGDWLLDVGCQQLKKGLEFHVLNPKEMSVLLHLCELAPDLVPTEDLLSRSWPEVVVGDHVLHEVMGRLRRMLGDSARQPSYIETLRKRGYRLIAPVQAPGARTNVALPPRTGTTVAVLPLEDLSPSRDLQWLAGRLREMLLVRLSRIEQLRLVPASYCLEHYGDPILAGQYLRANALVRGSVYPSADRMTLTVQVVETQRGALLWSADFAISADDADPQVPLEAVIGIETAVGLRGSADVSEVLDYARYGTNDMRAYTLWRRQFDLKFSSMPTAEDVLTALELNRQAVAIDPGYVMGYVGLGVTHLMLGRRRSDLREIKYARQALERAVELVPRHPIALGNLAVVCGLQREWARAVSLVQQAEPWTAVTTVGGVMQMYVWSLVNLGRWDDAVRALDEVRRIMEIAPSQRVGLNIDVAEATFWLWGDASAAVEILGQDGRHNLPGMVLPPQSGALPGSPPGQMVVQAHPRIAFVYRYSGLEEDAVDVFLRALSRRDQLAARQGYADGGWERMLRSVLESRREREVGSAGDGHPHPIPTVDLLASLGEREAMYDCLERQQAMFERFLEMDAERAHECGPGCSDSFAIPVWTAPPYSAYRGEPRFQRLLDGFGVVGHRNDPLFTLGASDGRRGFVNPQV